MQVKNNLRRIKMAAGNFIGIAAILTTVTAVSSLPLMEGSCSSVVPCVGARITYFVPASGIYYPEESVTSYLRFKNSGKENWTFWVSYGVRDQTGQWHNTASNPVTLDPKEESPTLSKTWYVPAQTQCTTGYYTAAMAIWDTRPEDGDAKKLAYHKQQNSFQVLRSFAFKHFNSFDKNLWEKSRHNLERSFLDPNHVDINNGQVRIKIPAGTLDGGELVSTNHFKYGTYRARILVANVPGSVTGFFLYRGPSDANNELDIEIYNDGKWQIMFTTWAYGIKTNTITKPLKFDPSAGYHEYRIDFYPQEVSFFVDAQLLQKYTSGLPTEAMRLLVNTWFPGWLQGEPPLADTYTYIDWIQY